MLYCCGAVSQDCRRADISSCEDCEWYRIVFFHHKGRNPSGPVMGSPIRGINPFLLPASPSRLCFAVFPFFSPVRPMANLPRRREDQKLRMVRHRALSLALPPAHRSSDSLSHSCPLNVPLTLSYTHTHSPPSHSLSHSHPPTLSLNHIVNLSRMQLYTQVTFHLLACQDYILLSAAASCPIPSHPIPSPLSLVPGGHRGPPFSPHGASGAVAQVAAAPRWEEGQSLGDARPCPLRYSHPACCAIHSVYPAIRQLVSSWHIHVQCTNYCYSL